VPVQDRPPQGLAYLLAAGGIICGGASAWLAVMDIRAKLHGYLVALGFLLPSLAMVSIMLLFGQIIDKRKMKLGRVLRVMILAGMILALVGIFVLARNHCGGNCGG
jgi:hypothetical protein